MEPPFLTPYLSVDVIVQHAVDLLLAHVLYDLSAARNDGHVGELELVERLDQAHTVGTHRDQQ